MRVEDLPEELQDLVYRPGEDVENKQPEKNITYAFEKPRSMGVEETNEIPQHEEHVEVVLEDD